MQSLETITSLDVHLGMGVPVFCHCGMLIGASSFWEIIISRRGC